MEGWGNSNTPIKFFWTPQINAYWWSSICNNVVSTLTFDPRATPASTDRNMHRQFIWIKTSVLNSSLIIILNIYNKKSFKMYYYLQVSVCHFSRDQHNKRNQTFLLLPRPSRSSLPAAVRPGHVQPSTPWLQMNRACTKLSVADPSLIDSQGQLEVK